MTQPSSSLQVRYSAAHGFLYTLSDFPEQYRLVVSDSALSSTSVHAGGVTLRNAPKFDALTTPVTTSTAIATLLPGCHVPMAVLVKTARPDGRTLFNVGIQEPASAAGPVDSSIWMKPTGVTFWGPSGAGTTTLGPTEAGAGKALGVLGRRRMREAGR